MKTSIKMFLTLSITSILIIFSIVFLATNAQQLVAHNHMAQKQFKHLILEVVKSKTTPAILNHNHFHAKIAKYPIKNAKIISIKNINELPHKIFGLHHIGKLSVKLNNNNWLNVEFPSPLRNFLPLLIGYIIITAILLTTLLTLFYLVIKKLRAPISGLHHLSNYCKNNLSNLQPLQKNTDPELNLVIDTFNQLQTKIQKLLLTKTQMLAAISHDLRTPITRLKLRAEYLENSPQYQKILADLDEMESMLNALIAFTRDDNYNEPVENFDLQALLESICNNMIDMGMQVEFIHEEKSIPYSGKMNALRRALNNVITNAVKYGKSATVKISQHKKNIKIEITDNGPGIPEESLEKVFEPFYRLEASRSKTTGGSGLGLAITRDIIRAHGGEIMLKNILPHGIKATILL